MKRFGRRFILLFLAAFLLAGSASANSAPPDYLVVVRVANGPEEPYDLSILAEEPRTYHLSYSHEEDVHRVEGYTMPKKFRVQIVTESGESWVSDTLERETLQMSVQVDWEARTARTPAVWVAYGTQFLSTLLPTLVFEGLVVLLFGYDWRRNWKPFLLVNLVTQGALTVLLSKWVVQSGLGAYSARIMFLFLIPVEILIMFVEATCYRRFLKGQPKARAVKCAVAANLASYVAGWFVVQAVWENITRVFCLGI